jgi:catechol 2,3-dioxygenase-like lactoylglutathione lyase family enzyme
VGTPTPQQVNLVVRDLARSLEFYRLLGWSAEPAGPHVSFVFDNGLRVELDQYEFAQIWHRGSPEPAGGAIVLSLTVEPRADVDAIVQRLAGAGHRVTQRPYDAFWGSRFAVVADPDGYQIGLMSPVEEERKFWPPQPAPD